LLAGSRDGMTEAMLPAHGFMVDILVDLIRAGLATAKTERMVAGGRPMEVARVRITDAGRRSLAISEYRKRSPQMRQCHWSRAKMYGRHSELFGSSLGSGILINPVSDAAAM
jgi:hypothetical protein